MAEPRIGYILKAFPVVSETFILNEIRAMEEAEVPLALLSLKRPPATVVHGAVERLTTPARRAPTRPWLSPRLLADHLRLIASAPSAYRRALRREVGRFAVDLLRRPSRRRWIRLRKHLRRLAWAGWVARRCRDLEIRHLHAHYAGEPLRVAHLVHRLTGIPYSFAAHAKDLYLAPRQRLRRRLATARFAVGCHLDGVETLRSLLPEEERSKVRHIPHGLDTALFRPRPTGGGRRILAVGRLTPKKGFEDLVDACAELARRGVRFHCEIVGEGRLRRDLEAAIRRHRLTDRVRIHGFVAQERLPARYRRAALLAAPCKELPDGNRDGVPNVVLEAMASGLPVVATDAAGIPEIVVSEVHGLLTPPGDPQALARALERLLTDRRLARRLGEAGARRARELDYRRANEPLARAFREILAAPVDEALDEAGRRAWRPGGLARKARKRLGLAPRRKPIVERSIRRAVTPGIRANAWRPDLVRLAGRRLWDEAIKANRLGSLLPMLVGPSPEGGRRVLDLGCGRGGLTVALRAHGFDVTGLDLRHRNCRVTRWRGRRYSLAVPTVTGVGEALPFADGSFDAVACLEVLEHVAAPELLLAEIRRVLQPAGRCVVTVINRWSHLDPHYHLWGINFLPRSLANRYIAARRRTKRSYRDRQTLDEMHYYRYREFERLAGRLGFAVREPALRRGGLAGAGARLQRALSLGFNAVTLVLEPLGAGFDRPETVAAAPGARRRSAPGRATGADAPSPARPPIRRRLRAAAGSAAGEGEPGRAPTDD